MLTVVPVDEASWADLQAIFGDRGDPARCRCQYFKDTAAEWRSGTAADRAERLRVQTADHATGLVAFLDGEIEIGVRDPDERVVTIGRGQVFVVPKGTFHKPSSKTGASVLLVEPAGTLSVGDAHDEVPEHVDVTTGHLV